MTQYLCIITIIVILIFILINNQKNKFTIFTQGISTGLGNLQLSEMYKYPSCSRQCITDYNELIPPFKYYSDNLADDRCFMAKNYIPTGILDGAFNKDSNSIIQFDSCDPNLDTRYSTSVIGRYVKIIRTRLISPYISGLSILSMQIYNNNAQIIPIATYYSPVTDALDTMSTSVLAENIITNNTNNSSIRVNITNQTGYIWVDLGSDQRITKVIIYFANNATIDLCGFQLIIIDSANNYKFKFDSDDYLNLFNIPIPTTSIIYTTNQNVISNAFNKLCDNTNKQLVTIYTIDSYTGGEIAQLTPQPFSYPACAPINPWNTGYLACVSYPDRKTKPNFIYNISDNRCLVSKNVCNNINCLDDIVNYTNTDIPTILNNFNSCTGTYYTQLSTITGRYLLFINTNTLNSMYINKIAIYDKYNNEITNPTSTVYSTSADNNARVVVDNNDATYINVYPANLSFIIFDLGFDMEIATVKVIAPVGYFNSLSNIRIIIASDAASSSKPIVYTKTFTNSINNLTIYTQKIATYTTVVVLTIPVVLLLVRFDGLPLRDLSPNNLQFIRTQANYDGSIPSNLNAPLDPLSTVSMSIPLNLNPLINTMFFDMTKSKRIDISSSNLILNGDFTIQFWAYHLNDGWNQIIFLMNEKLYNTTGGILFRPTYNLGSKIVKFPCIINGVPHNDLTFTSNQWNYWTITRNALSGDLYIYCNGKIASAVWTGVTNIINGKGMIRFCAGYDQYFDNIGYIGVFNGYLYDFRIIKGLYMTSELVASNPTEVSPTSLSNLMSVAI